MPRGLPFNFPIARLRAGKRYDGPKIMTCRTRIMIASCKFDPREFPPMDGTTPEKFENGINPDPGFEKLSLEKLILLWTQRASTFDYRGRHPQFELFVHLVFPAEEERTLAHIAIWKIRDRVSNWEIGRRLTTKATRGRVRTRMISRLWEYIQRRFAQFIHRHRLKQKFSDIKEPTIEEFIDSQRDPGLPTEVRRLIIQIKNAIKNMSKQKKGLGEDLMEKLGMTDDDDE